MKQLWVLALLLGLVAARPWGIINHQLGLEPAPADSLATAVQDSLFAQPMIITLPPAAVDTLSARVAQRDSVLNAQKARLKTVDQEIASNERKLQQKQKVIIKQQENMVSLEEIYDLYDKQSTRKKDFP